MQTALKEIEKTEERGTYLHVVVIDEEDTEYELNFPIETTDDEIKSAWINENCWRVI